MVVHLVSGLDPLQHRLSEYVNGPGGGLMFAAFVVIGTAQVALGSAMWGSQRTGRAAKAASIAIIAAGIATMVAGFFPTDPGAATTAEIVHSRASGVATLLLIAAAVAWSVPGPGRSRGLTALAAVAVLLAPLSAALHETTATGLGQRLLWLTLGAWLTLAAVRSQDDAGATARPTNRLAGGPDQGR